MKYVTYYIFYPYHCFCADKEIQMRIKFVLLTVLLACVYTFFTAGCATSSQTQPQTQPASPTQISPYSNTAQGYPADTSGQDNINQTANQFATSYNQAVMDKQALSQAAMANDHQRSQELIRSYSRNLEVSKDSYQMLREIAEDQGTGDITIFFPHNSAQIIENSLQHDRLIRYLDSLERNNRERQLVFVIIGSASAVGEDNHNQILSKKRANATVPIIDQYLINVPHTFHKVYGTGEANSPKNETEDINKRYRFVRIMALYGSPQTRSMPAIEPMMPLGPSIPMSDQRIHTTGVRQVNEYTNSVGMKFIRVPAGTFMMGSPDSEIQRDTNEILHEVTITQPYYLQATEVTQQQWMDVMSTQPSHFKNCGIDCPVENIRHTEAMEFLNRLNKLERTKHYRLPTEAEWEYACRAGTTSAFFNGPMVTGKDFNHNPYLDSVGWYYHNASHAPHRVGLKSPNAWGFYDMHGNVWEWCSDWYGDYPSESVTDPQGPSDGSVRVVRGGSWYNGARGCRSALRGYDHPGYRGGDVGVRLVRSLP